MFKVFIFGEVDDVDDSIDMTIAKATYILGNWPSLIFDNDDNCDDDDDNQMIAKAAYSNLYPGKLTYFDIW